MKSTQSSIRKIIFILILCASPAIYLGLIAQDRFQSVSHFSVVVEESSNAEASVGLLNLVGASTGSASDAQIAIGFINSTDLLFELENEFALSEHYSAPPKDFIFRLKPGAKKEDRIKYYRKKIFAELDDYSGLIYLTVESFSPDLSQDMSQYILKKTEALINDLNKSIANRRLAFAQGELSRAHNSIKQHETALIDFQNKNKIIHPEAIIQAQLEAIQTLRLEKIHKEIELATLEANSPNSPVRADLKISIANLNNEISKQEASLSGSDAQKLNRILANYKELELNLEFALSLRKGAELVLEKTRADTISTSRFFSVIQNPYLSDDNTHPRRWYLSITSAIALLLGLFVIKAIIASIYDRVQP